MKSIIDNKCEWLNFHTALACVSDVIKEGKISNGRYGKQFCHITTFSFNAGEIGVSASKTKTGTHTFKVFEVIR